MIVTAGGKQALYNTALALFGPGDEVITHAPYWPTLPEQIKLADATPVPVETPAADGFAIRAGAMLERVTPRTRGIIVNSPCNPTGAVISEPDFEAIADFCGRQGIWLVVDLCYEKLIYDPVPHNLPGIMVAEMPRRRRHLRVGVEGVRDDRLAMRLGARARGAHRGVRRDPEPRDVECRRRSRRRRSSPRSPVRRSRSARCSTSIACGAIDCTNG